MIRGVLAILLAAFACSACDYKPRNQGKAIYNKHCQSCHMEEGDGLGALMPPLSNSDFVTENPDQLACIIRFGISGEITVNGVMYDSEMAGNKQLTDVEVNNLIHFLLEDFNQMENPFSLKDIKNHLESCD